MFFRSIFDEDGPKVADTFYEYLFKQNNPTMGDKFQPDITHASRALHLAITKLCSEGVPFIHWVPFIHLGR